MITENGTIKSEHLNGSGLMREELKKLNSDNIDHLAEVAIGINDFTRMVNNSSAQITLTTILRRQTGFLEKELIEKLMKKNRELAYKNDVLKDRIKRIHWIARMLEKIFFKDER